MQKRLKIFLLLMAAIYALFAWQYDGYGLTPLPAPQANNHSWQKRILLVPLDSRPPCRDFIRDSARLVNWEIDLPPTELMDYYSAPGDTIKMQQWLRDRLKGHDTAFLSIDQLLSGGLLASREGHATPEKAKNLISFLRQLHKEQPQVKLQAFSILPRMLPPDSIDGATERKQLIRYSRLKDKEALGDATEEEKAEILSLRGDISCKALTHYESLYIRHQRLCEELIKLVQEGVLDRLIIGRDDGEKLGMPNIEARYLENYLKTSKLPETRACLTHGADELALTMLAACAAKDAGYVPRISLAYGRPEMAACLLPYMAGSMETTAKEKLALVYGQEVTAEQADFMLFMSAVDSKSLDSRLPAVRSLKKLLKEKKNVALVDLSRHFSTEETLLPLMLQERAPIQQLSAYAGWNTASNSIGTAVAHGVLVEIGRRQAQSADEQLHWQQARLTLLNQRFLEDNFYLKDIVDSVNYSLRKEGYFNVSDLDMDHNYHWANTMLQTAMAERRRRLELSPAFRIPVLDDKGNTPLTIRRLREEVWYPWPRTFEIKLQVETELGQKK